MGRKLTSLVAACAVVRMYLYVLCVYSSYFISPQNEVVNFDTLVVERWFMRVSVYLQRVLCQDW